jgi:hypothetical protein
MSLTHILFSVPNGYRGDAHPAEMQKRTAFMHIMRRVHLSELVARCASFFCYNIDYDYDYDYGYDYDYDCDYDWD